MKKKYKWFLAAVIAVISAGAYIVSLMKPVIVETEDIVIKDMTVDFSVRGTIEPGNSKILNAGSNGELLELLGQQGKLLEEGSVIARIGGGGGSALELQREQYRQQLTGARKQYDTLFGAQGTAIAQEEAAKSQYDLAVKNYNNAKVLADQGGFVSESELSALKTQMEVAGGALSQAKEANSDSSRAYYKEQISSYEKQLETMEGTVKEDVITMPYQGILWETYAEAGTYISQNQPVAKIYQPGDMKLTASLLAEDALLLTEGTEAKVSYANGQETTATVTFISQVAKQKLSTIGLEENRCNVELKPQEIPAGIGAGYQADITFTLMTASGVYSVPTKAIVPVDNKHAVYLIRGEKAVLVPVETGEKSGGRIRVLSGLLEGDVVITDPYGSEIQQGSRVKAEES